ncbi:patatin-like phospholipase family protein, partial [Pseudomonadota bacterium]
MYLSTRFVTAALLALLVSACGSLERREAVPEQAVQRAQIPGIANARFWPMSDNSAIVAEALASLDKEQAARQQDGETGPLPPVAYLAISGGGDNGAFGAGLLNGWSARGDRPQFKVVTGVSTGGLIAPFAFLGSDYDDELSQVYTSVTQKDIFNRRSMLAALTEDGLGDTTPLYELIGKFVDDKFLAAVAEAYRRGRFLFIGTTNLDAQQPVIWNMGAIAAANTPESADLFHRIMLASASIPGAFSPVMIDVEVDEVQYQEMHVDGGTMAQVFLYPPAISTEMDARNLQNIRERRAYILRNARLDSNWSSVERSTVTITGKAIATLLQSQGFGDLYRIYLTTQEDGVDYNLAYIGSDFNAEHREEFDALYMRKLYDYA